MNNIVGMCPYPTNSEWEKSGNPILAEIVKSIESSGWKVVPVSIEDLEKPQRILEKKVDVLHFHWASAVFNIDAFRKYGVPNIIDKKITSANSLLVKKIYKGYIKVHRYVVGYFLRKYLYKTITGKINNWQEALRQTNIPIVWQQHDILSHNTERNPALFRTADRFLHSALYTLASAIVVHELSSLPFIFDFYGSKKKYALAYLGPANYGERKSKQKARDDLKITGNGKVLAYIGTGRTNRNPRNSIGIFLKYANANDVFIVAGQNTARFVHQKDKRIILFDGFIQAGIIRDIYCAADFIINDAQNYLTSYVLRNSLLYGTPVITYPFGNAIDMVKDAAIFIDTDGDGLERALEKALRINTDAKEYGEMVKAAEIRDQERGWEKSGIELVKLYRSLANPD